MPKIVIEDYSKPEQPKIVLECTLRAGQSYALGRNPANDIYLDHPSISRLHAILFDMDGVWHIHDPGSKKGVTNPDGISVSNEPLKDGSHHVIGPTRMWFQSDQTSTPAARKPKRENEFASILQCTLTEKDNPWMEGESTEQVFNYCMTERRSLTVGSGVECDLTLPTPELADKELLLFELNDTWHFSCLSDQTVTGSNGTMRSGKLAPHEECVVGPLKFSIFRAKMMC